MPPDLIRPLALAHGLAFADLHTVDGAARLDGLFAAHLRWADASLAARLGCTFLAPDAAPDAPVEERAPMADDEVWVVNSTWGTTG